MAFEEPDISATDGELQSATEQTTSAQHNMASLTCADDSSTELNMVSSSAIDQTKISAMTDTKHSTKLATKVKHVTEISNTRSTLWSNENTNKHDTKDANDADPAGDSDASPKTETTKDLETTAEVDQDSTSDSDSEIEDNKSQNEHVEVEHEIEEYMKDMAEKDLEGIELGGGSVGMDISTRVTSMPMADWSIYGDPPVPRFTDSSRQIDGVRAVDAACVDDMGLSQSKSP